MRRPSERGFTLVELMIVVVVIGVLAAIAYPSYDKYITRARRSDAQQFMTEISSKQVQYLFDARSYAVKIATGGLGIIRTKWTCSATAVDVADVCANSYYEVTISDLANNATPPSFKITATAIGTQAPDGNLTLDSTGAKTGTW